MDNVLMIRVIAGILAVILLTIIIARRKRMSSLKRPSTRDLVEWRNADGSGLEHDQEHGAGRADRCS